MLALHIFSAIVGLLLALGAVLQPNQRALASCVMVSTVIVVGSGAALLWQTPQSIGHLCLSGFSYLAIVGGAMVYSRRRRLAEAAR